MRWDEVIRKGYDKFLKDHQDLEYVVRCKDCRHLSENRIAPDWHRICRLQGVGKADDGFCDEAERKETEDGRSNTVED